MSSLGVPNLTSKLQVKVHQANILMKVALKICRLFLKFKVRFVFLENPLTSWVWFANQVQQLLDDGCDLIRVDQCMYGAPWKKATNLLCGNLDPMTWGPLPNAARAHTGFAAAQDANISTWKADT